jgi:GGDEF domain-containing protein
LLPKRDTKIEYTTRAAGVHRETSWSFIQRTDEALYAAKRKGRNCWVVIKEIDGDRL